MQNKLENEIKKLHEENTRLQTAVDVCSAMLKQYMESFDEACKDNTRQREVLEFYAKNVSPFGTPAREALKEQPK